MSLFCYGQRVQLHSGSATNFLIDCTALTNDDLDAIAAQVAYRWNFQAVLPIPKGGLRFARSLTPYVTRCAGVCRVLIVDDVATTGSSFEEAAVLLIKRGMEFMGVCLFSRGPVPAWVEVIFRGHEYLSPDARGEMK